MRKKVWLIFVILFSLLSVSFGQKSQTTIVSREIIDLFSGEVSGKICYENIRDLSVFCRWFGSDDMIEAAEFVKRQAKKYGLTDAWVEKFKVDADTYYFMQKPWHAWNCEFGELRMIAPSNKLITSSEANGPCVLVNSRDTDVEAELVYVGSGSDPKDYEGKDVEGKIVLASGYPWLVSKLAIFEHGAAGVVTAWGLDDPGSQSTEIYQTRIQPWNEDKSKLSTFGFFLSTNQGRALMDVLGRGEKVVLHAKIKAEVRVPGFHPGVIATIPGSTFPNEEIVFTAHLDHPRPGAHDNNSGCAVLLEVARTIRSLVDRKIIESPKRTLRFYWTPHVWGVDMLYSVYPELLPKAIASFNVDCVGLNQTKFSSGFTVVKAPFTRASFLDDVVVNVLNYLILSNNNHMGRLSFGPMMTDHDGSRNVFYGRVVPYMDYSDHIFFSSGNVGVPAVTLIDLPFGSHHSQNDELDLIDPTQLKRISFLAAVASYFIASAGPEDAMKIIDEIYHQGRSRLEREMRLAKNLIYNSDEADISSNFSAGKSLLFHCFAREKQALESTDLFIKGEVQARSYLSNSLEKLNRFEDACRDEFQEFFKIHTTGRGMRPSFMNVSGLERKLEKMIPRRNPELKGSWGILNIYPDDKYALEKYSPMQAYLFEVLNRIDGKTNMLEIVEAAYAEALSSNYQIFSREEILEFLQNLRKEGIISYND